MQGNFGRIGSSHNVTSSNNIALALFVVKHATFKPTWQNAMASTEFLFKANSHYCYVVMKVQRILLVSTQDLDNLL